MNKLQLFQEQKIRTHWDEKEEKWYFSIIDIVEILTDSSNPRDYWYRVKKRLGNNEKAELSTICRQLKMQASDGKMRITDCANTEGVFRIIQSIPSPKAEHSKSKADFIHKMSIAHNGNKRNVPFILMLSVSQKQALKWK